MKDAFVFKSGRMENIQQSTAEESSGHFGGDQFDNLSKATTKFPILNER